MCAPDSFTNKKLGVMLFAYYPQKMSKLRCSFELPMLRRIFVHLHAPAKENFPMHAQNKKSNGVTLKRQCCWLREGMNIASRFILQNVFLWRRWGSASGSAEGLGGRAGMGTSMFPERCLIWLCACGQDVHSACQNQLELPAKHMSQGRMPPDVSGS